MNNVSERRSATVSAGSSSSATQESHGNISAKNSFQQNGILDYDPPGPGFFRRAFGWLVNTISLKILALLVTSVLAVILSSALDFVAMLSAESLRHDQDLKMFDTICSDATKTFETGNVDKCNVVRASLRHSPFFKTLQRFVRKFYLCGEQGCFSYMQDFSSGFIVKLIVLLGLAVALFLILSSLFTKLKIHQYKLQKQSKLPPETRVIRGKDEHDQDNKSSEIHKI